jgi:hypothetical protein
LTLKFVIVILGLASAFLLFYFVQISQVLNKTAVLSFGASLLKNCLPCWIKSGNADAGLLLVFRIFSGVDAHLWTTEKGLDTPGADLVTFTRDRRLNLKDLAGTSQALNK